MLAGPNITLALATALGDTELIWKSLKTGAAGFVVAVALLPPTATMGLMLGAGKFKLAVGAGLLLVVNGVSVNLSAKVTFLARGFKPRTWLEKQTARQSMTVYIVFWVVTLSILRVAIYLRHQTLP